MPLDRFLNVGLNPVTSAQDLFTDRVNEMAFFENSILAVRRTHQGGRSAIAEVAGRTNVLVFHGESGIGKSRLSEVFRQRFDAGDYRDPAKTHQSLRLDFDDKGNFDLDVVLRQFRATLGPLGSWHAFDIAAAWYWRCKRPGMRPEQYLQQAVSARVAERSDIRGQIKEAFLLVAAAAGVGVPAIAVGVSLRGGEALWSKIVGQHRHSAALRECELLREILAEDEPDKIRALLPAILAWDLAMRLENQPADVVFFMDTWENVEANSHHLGDTEDLLSQMIYLMPNVLFVLTSRNRLTWAEPSSSARMKLSGKDRWPNLAAGAGDDPMQHAVDVLSAPDCHRYLEKRLVMNGRPAIPQEIRDRIVDGSGGLPLYLDLSAELFDRRIATNVADQDVSIFGGPLPQIVDRVMRDLDPASRQLLRAAALAGNFNRDLLRAGSPVLVSDAVIDRFLARSFVRTSGRSWLNSSLHDVLRKSVRKGDLAVEDAWSEREWLACSERMIAELGRVVEPYLPERELADRPVRSTTDEVDTEKLSEAFLAGFDLAAECQENPSEWLVRAAAVLLELGKTDVLVYPAGRQLEPRSAWGTFANGLRALAVRRRAEGVTGSLEALRDSAHDDRAGALARDVFTRFYSQTLDWVGRNDQSLIEIQRLADSDGPLKSIGTIEKAYLLLWRGRMADAQEAVATLDPLGQYAFWIDELRGQVQLRHAEFDEATRSFRASLDAARSRRSTPNEATALANLGRSLAWTDPAAALPRIDEALKLWEGLQDYARLAHCWGSRAIALVGMAPESQIRDAIDRCREWAHASGQTSEQLSAPLAELFVACVEADAHAAIQAQDDLARAARAAGRDLFWIPVSGRWLDAIGQAALSPRTEEVQWLTDEEEVLSRWSAVLLRRRAERSL